MSPVLGTTNPNPFGNAALLGWAKKKTSVSVVNQLSSADFPRKMKRNLNQFDRVRMGTCNATKFIFDISADLITSVSTRINTFNRSFLTEFRGESRTIPPRPTPNIKLNKVHFSKHPQNNQFSRQNSIQRRLQRPPPPPPPHLHTEMK